MCQTVCFPSPPNLLKQDNYAVRSFTRCCKTQGTEKQMEDLKQSNLQLWQKTVQSYRDTKEKTGAVQKVVCCGRVNINMVFQMWTYSIFIVCDCEPEFDYNMNLQLQLTTDSNYGGYRLYVRSLCASLFFRGYRCCLSFMV